MGARFDDVFDAAFQAVKRHEDDNLRASAFALYINFSQTRTRTLSNALPTMSPQRPLIIVPAVLCCHCPSAALLFTEDSKFYETGKVQLLSSLPELLSLPGLSAKLVYRLLVILGSLIYDDPSTTSLAVDLEIPDAVETACKAHSADQPVQDVARELQQALTKTS